MPIHAPIARSAAEPVFRSVGQALHVSFLMEQLPPTQKGSTQIFIEDLLRRHFRLDELPRHERSINASGLTPLEMRAQCAIVRAAVTHHLPTPERDAIHARFGYQLVKAGGVRGLAEYCGPLCATANADALLALCWALYAPRNTPRDHKDGRAGDWSLRALEKEYGVSKSTLGRDQRMVRITGDALEKRGQERLGELFERTNLVGEA
jgi:hypothetical protein